MKRIRNTLFVLATTAFALTLGLGTAQAQVTSTGTNQGIVDLTLSGTIQSALVLAINGAGSTTLTATGSNVMPTTSTALVDFGTFNTQSASLTNGKIVRTTAGTAGAFAVAELAAVATYSGNAGGASAANINLTLGAAGGASPIVAGNTRVQRTPAVWTDSANGSTVSAVAVSICPNGDSVNGDCASGTSQSHELAVFVPDTQGAGNFTQVVRYTATAY
jgi:hypothetical protein